MKTLASSPKSRFRYLPVLAEQRKWGLFLTDCGYTVIEPGTPYPPRGHPDAYADGWTKGRTLGLGYTTFRHRFKKGLPRTICAGPRAALMVHGVKSTRSFKNRRGAVAVAVSRSVTVSRPSPSGTVW